jgi:hypothetical protein
MNAKSDQHDEHKGRWRVGNRVRQMARSQDDRGRRRKPGWWMGVADPAEGNELAGAENGDDPEKAEEKQAVDVDC